MKNFKDYIIRYINENAVTFISDLIKKELADNVKMEEKINVSKLQKVKDTFNIQDIDKDALTLLANGFPATSELFKNSNKYFKDSLDASYESILYTVNDGSNTPVCIITYSNDIKIYDGCLFILNIEASSKLLNGQEALKNVYNDYIKTLDKKQYSGLVTLDICPLQKTNIIQAGFSKDKINKLMYTIKL